MPIGIHRWKDYASPPIPTGIHPWADYSPPRMPIGIHRWKDYASPRIPTGIHPWADYSPPRMRIVIGPQFLTWCRGLQKMLTVTLKSQKMFYLRQGEMYLLFF